MSQRIYFICLACFRPTFTTKIALGREAQNCTWCKSTSRERAILFQIHKQVLLKKARHPFRKVKILGVSDGDLTATVLARVYKKRYTNYHYHIEPKLDITNIPQSLTASADIVSCSEVLEHVQPPIQNAFDGLYQILKSDGVLVLSVPHTDINGEHIEHFPIMTDSRLLESGSKYVLVGKSLDGKKLEFANLTFHGGIGTTLEYRIFSQKSLIKSLELSNFKKLISCKNIGLLGINWEPWSRVWTANK